MTGGKRRDDGDLPVFDALEPGDFTGAGPRPPARRGGLGPARGAGIAAGALVLLVGAIAVGGLSPDPTPFISPTVPCSTLAPTPDIGASLVVGSSAPVPGAPNSGSALPEVHARLGDPIRIIIDGEVCAVRWDIELVNVETGEAQKVDRFDRPNDDPAYAAQNRWDVSTFGQQILTADLHLPGGIDVVRSWRIIVDPFVVPALFLVGPNGVRFEATAGCGLYVRLSNGYEANDDCGSIGYAPGPEALVVRAYRAIHLDLAGWDIVGWGADCGRVTGVGAVPFEAPDGCTLGGGYSDSGVALEDPPAFLLPPRDTVVRIYIAAIDDAGNQYNVSYFAHVIAR